MIGQTPDLIIRMRYKASKYLHLASIDPLGVVALLVPCWNVVRSGSEFGVLRNDSSLFLTLKNLLPIGIPTLIEFPLVFCAPLRRRMQW